MIKKGQNMEDNITTPLDSFINHKANTGMQCGNYSIDIPKLKVFTLMLLLVLGVTVVK